MDLTYKAIRVLKTMDSQNGFLTPSQARSNRDAVCELQEQLLIAPGKREGVDGFVFTRTGATWNQHTSSTAN